MDELDEIIKQINDEFGEGTATTADNINRPEPKQSVKEIELFNEFNIRNPKADGGMLVQPSADGRRPEYGRPSKKTKLTKKQVQEIYKDLPDNVYVMVQERGKDKIPEYTYRAGVRGDRIGKENWRMALKATPENKKKIIEATEKKLNEYYPNRLTREEYAKIRLKPENRRLRGEDFAKKLNKIGYTTATGAEWNRDSVYNFDLESPRTKKRIADDLGFFEKRTVAEAKEIIKKFSGGKHFLKNKNLTDADITTRAASYVAMEKFEDRSGTGRSWPRGKQNKRKIWTNIYNSYRQGGRFKLINEKKLADASGKVNWKKDLNWRKAKFKDKKSGAIFTYENLEKMVDKHGGGYKKAIKAYNDNAILNQITFNGKSLNSILSDGLLKKEYETLVRKKVNLNDPGLLEYISEKKPFYSFVEAHHTEGVKDNPFKTEPAFRYANRKQGIEQTKYNKAVASGDSNRILKAREVYINEMNKMSNELGGIRYKTDGKFIGKKGTPESIVKAATETAGISKNVQNKILQRLQANSKLPQCKIAAADGGRIGFALSDECIRDGLNETKKSAAAGDKKAARQLVETAEAASKGGRLLKNVIGPGAILGEALFEGAIIGNKVLGGKPLKQAWAESYLSYLDPRKYRGELDPLLLERDRMLERSGYKDVLRSGFAAQDRISAFNEARAKEELAKIRQRPDQLMTEAEREKLRAYEKQSSPFIKDSQLQKDANIISDEAFQDASRIAQESLQGLEGQKRFDLGVASTPQGENADFMRRQRAKTAMDNLYTQYSDNQIRSFLKDALDTDDDNVVDRYLELTGETKRIIPGIARTMSGIDKLRTGLQEQEALLRFADNFRAEKAGGGIAKLAGDRSGAMLESMNPDKDGLQGILNRVKRT